MAYQYKTLRRWYILILEENQYQVLRCPSNKKLKVVSGVDLFGPIERFYELDSVFLLSDRQKVIKENKLKKEGYVEKK